MRALWLACVVVLGAACPRSDRPSQFFPRDCNPVEYHIAPGGGGSGSREQPYGYLSDAVRAARAQRACGIIVHAAPGTYPAEHVDLDRHTAILGEDLHRTRLPVSLAHAGPHVLYVGEVTLGPTVDRAAIRVDHPDARTTVYRVRITRAAKHAVAQAGGSVRLEEVIVDETRGTSDDVAHGTAIALTGGVTAFWRAVTLLENDKAVSLRGDDTLAIATELSVRKTRHNAHFDRRVAPATLARAFAAVEVSDAATLAVTGLSITESDIAGLTVHSGGRLSLRDGTIADTSAFSPETFGIDDADALRIGGTNLLVADDGVAELRDLVSEDAELAAAHVDRAYLTAWDLTLARSTIGLAHRAGADHPYTIDRLLACTCRTLLEDNERNLDSDRLPLPTPGPDCPVARDCPRVRLP